MTPVEPAPAVVSLETVPTEWLTDEIARRLLQGSPELVAAAVARAEAAEGQLQTLKQWLASAPAPVGSEAA